MTRELSHLEVLTRVSLKMPTMPLIKSKRDKHTEVLGMKYLQLIGMSLLIMGLLEILEKHLVIPKDMKWMVLKAMVLSHLIKEVMNQVKRLEISF